MGYRIKTLEIEAFQGVNNHIIVDFKSQSTLLKGENGSGKTSILRAIEFALYGTIHELQGSTYSRSRNEINNFFNEEKEAKVTIIFENNEKETLSIIRIKDYNDKNSKIQEIKINGTNKTGNLESYLAHWRNLSKEDFQLLAYLTQENFQQILEYKPKDRAAAFNRLFNVEVIISINNEIRKFIEIKSKESGDLKKKINLLIEEQQKIENKRQEHNEKLDNEIENHDNEYFDFQFNYTRKIIGYGNKLLEKDITAISDMRDETDKFIKSLGQNKQTIETIDINDLIEKSSSLQQLQDTIEEILGLFDEKDEKAASGKDAESITREINDLDENLADINFRLHNSNKFSQFLNMAVEDIIDSNTKECPICHNKKFDYNKIRTNILNEIKEVSGREVDDLKRQKILIEDDIQMNNAKLKEIIDLMSKIEEQIYTHNSILKNIVESNSELQMDKYKINNESSNAELNDMQKMLESELNEIQKRINQIGVTLKKSGQRSETLTDLIELRDICDSIINLNKIESTVISLDDDIKSHNKWVSELQKRLQILDSNIENYKNAQKIIVDGQQTYILNKIDHLNPKIKELYSIITPHNYWSELKIDLTSKKSRGTITTSYDLKTANSAMVDEVNLKAYFSKGQANRSILSILLAIGANSENVFNFQLLDDVTQSLDNKIINNLSEACSELSDEVQMIIATADDTFSDGLEMYAKKGEKEFQVITLKEWTSEDGVKI